MSTGLWIAVGVVVWVLFWLLAGALARAADRGDRQEADETRDELACLRQRHVRDEQRREAS